MEIGRQKNEALEKLTIAEKTIDNVLKAESDLENDYSIEQEWRKQLQVKHFFLQYKSLFIPLKIRIFKASTIKDQEKLEGASREISFSKDKIRVRNS